MFQELFDKYRINDERAKSYGFKLEESSYSYQQPIMNEDFLLVVHFQDNQLDFQVLDQETGDEYVQVKMEELTGRFVRQVREACEQVLLDIRVSCLNINSFYPTKPSE